MEIMAHIIIITIFSLLIRQSLSVPSICTTPACQYAASQILERMDSSVEPCDNFYKFACGGYEKKSIMPKGKRFTAALYEIHDKTKEQLRKTLEEPSPPTEFRPFTLAKNFYKSCVNTELINTESRPRLLKLLETLGGWPVLKGDSWEENFDWIQSLYKFRKLGFSYDQFVNLEIFTDTINPEENALFVREEIAPPSKDIENHMVNIAVALGADRESAKKELDDAFKFWKAIVELSKSNPMVYPDSLKRMTIADLYNAYPTIQWKKFFNHFLPPSVSFDNGKAVVLTSPNYISKLVALIKTTPKRVQANYAIWRVIDRLIGAMDKELIGQRYKSGNETEKEHRSVRCLEIARRQLPLSIGAMYVRKFFTAEAKKDALAMFDDMRNQYKLLLTRVDWMDDETKNKALEKLAAMPAHIAYPDQLLNDSILEKYYQDLETNDGLYLDAVLNLTLFSSTKSLKELEEPIDEEWMRYADTLNVYVFYNYYDNSLLLPAGVLQDVFFSKDQPNYVNYGAVGSIMGHEISHAFDAYGRNRNKDGHEADWWAPSTAEKYQEKAQCIVDQYDKYSVEGLGKHLNGTNTLLENMADNVGLKIAYLAYRAFVARNGPEPKLPGLSYTPRQLFWMSIGSVYCEKVSKGELSDILDKDDHTLGEFRVMGSLSNIPQFSEDFGCPVGSPMNPEKKCLIF